MEDKIYKECPSCGQKFFASIENRHKNSVDKFYEKITPKSSFNFDINHLLFKYIFRKSFICPNCGQKV